MDYRQTLAPGTTLLDQYRIVRVLGVGGFGITYMARDSGLEVDVAIKEYFPAEFGMRDPSMTVRPATSSQAPVFEQCRASFLREARTLAQFRHPSIVRVLRVFEAHGTAYTVMEYIAGQSLASWAEALKRRPRQSELDGILKPLISALDDLHAASFIHRDIAPDNILIRSDGSPVLIDFGATRQVLASASRNFTGVVKQGYSPPEQYAMDAKLQGPWTDVYALGGILYWLVTGEKPVPAPERQLGIAQRPATAATGGYRRTFLEGIDRALALTPGDRPQSLTELSRLLVPPDRPVRDEPTVRPNARTEQIAAEPWSPPGSETWSKALRTALPMAGAALVGLALIWQAGGFGTGSPPIPVSAEQREIERQRVVAAEAQRLELERRAASEKLADDERRRAEAERQRIDAEKRAAAEKRAVEERRQAAERAETERQRAEAERLRIEVEKRAAAERQAAEDRRRAIERVESERQRVDAEKRAAAEKLAAEERRRAEAERLRIDSEKRAAAEKQAADDRRVAAERAEAERQRIEAERRALAEAQAEEQRRRAAEQEAERQRVAAEQLAIESQRILVADIRRELNRLGCTTRATTPGWADDDQRALERFVRDSGGTVSFPRLDLEIVRVLQAARQRICQPCPAGESEVNGRCVADPPRTTTPPVSAAVQCRQINERAQLGLLTEEDRIALRRLNCR